ncbi:MAG: adenosylmethionine decarboxylase [Alphaproteobacteria bacterium]|nr:adenosylmethionine decarboxylase [Alphaproteobacteria bacterium]
MPGVAHAAAAVTTEDRVVSNDHFITKDGVEFAGSHLLIDLWDCRDLDDLALVERMLREAVGACKATLLNLFLHHFGEEQGVSGVAVLAESHISIHTWPERGFAAIDIFMCGACDPHAAIPVLKRHLAPGSVKITEARRGLRK